MIGAIVLSRLYRVKGKYGGLYVTCMAVGRKYVIFADVTIGKALN